jgi:hypothetical protein
VSQRRFRVAAQRDAERMATQSAQTLRCRSPRGWAAAACAHEAMTIEVVPPDCSASCRANGDFNRALMTAIPVA